MKIHLFILYGCVLWLAAVLLFLPREPGLQVGDDVCISGMGAIDGNIETSRPFLVCGEILPFRDDPR